MSQFDGWSPHTFLQGQGTGDGSVVVLDSLGTLGVITSITGYTISNSPATLSWSIGGVPVLGGFNSGFTYPQYVVLGDLALVVINGAVVRFDITSVDMAMSWAICMSGWVRPF